MPFMEFGFRTIKETLIYSSSPLARERQNRINQRLLRPMGINRHSDSLCRAGFELLRLIPSDGAAQCSGRTSVKPKSGDQVVCTVNCKGDSGGESQLNPVTNVVMCSHT